jgi:hypothetical protein
VGAHLEPEENEKNPWPHIGNLMGTSREHVRKTGKTKKILSTQSPKT